ncbi:hypothetical protein PQX77_018407 [Marasmius sp. AFHP31]|nr:hypothetical protein PQX77_018407 [Marasmius sp. AFHP31]
MASLTVRVDVYFHPTSNKEVACRVCNEGLPLEQYTWLKKVNFNKHCTRQIHLDSVERQRQRQRLEEQQALQYARLLHASHPVLLPAPQIAARVPPPVPAAPSYLQSEIAASAMNEFDSMTHSDLETLYPVELSQDETHEQINETVRAEFQQILDEVVYEDVYNHDELNVDVDELPEMVQELQDMGLTDTAEILRQLVYGVSPDHNYYPYPNAIMCFLDILDNLPRLRFSEAQLKMILWLLKLCGVEEVPSFDTFRKLQANLREKCGARVNEHVSDMGNVFSSISVEDLAARDFANPMVAPEITLYPDDTDGTPISEMWQIPSGRWLELPQDLLPPSLVVENKRFYIHELAELQDGRWVIPQLWITSKNVLYAECYVVNKLAVTSFRTTVSVTSSWIRIPVLHLKLTHEELLSRCRQIEFDHTDMSQDCVKRIPNVNRQIDGGEDLFTSWWSLWSDDVSGARSKQYQKHMNVYSQHVNLPSRLLQQQFFVHPISVSPHAGSLEQFKPIVQQVRKSHSNPIRTFNASTHRPCRIRLFVPDLPADNPQQSDEASHIGHQGLVKCRTCKPGESGKFHATTHGYGSFYASGTPRNVQEIRACVLEQIRLATYGVNAPIETLQTETGVKDKIACHWIDILLQEAVRRQAESPSQCQQEISDQLLAWLGSQTDQPYNPLLDIPFLDVSQDTLVEILHTILLGVEKYGWHNLHSNWDEKQRTIFTVRLQSTNTDGLSIPPIRAEYMMQYRNGLIGKHFKTLIQLIRALGELGTVLWIPEIEDMDIYLNDLTILIDNVLDAFAEIDPSRILGKIKLHMLVHIPSQIHRRGPAVRFSTEIEEAFNAVFRLCSVLSNHQAASRDIANQLVDLDRVKHIITGGYWRDADGRWVTAGQDVRTLLQATPMLQSHMGWHPPSTWTPGAVRAEPFARDCDGRRARTRPTHNYQETSMARSLDLSHLNIPPQSAWVKGVNVTSLSGDNCVVGSWVICRYEIQDNTQTKIPTSAIGQVESLYLPETFGSSGPGLLVLNEHTVADSLHFKLRMPVLKPSGRKLLLNSKVTVQFEINVQHDCEGAGCTDDGVENVRQERKQSASTRKVLVHRYDAPNSCRVINTHAFHNARYLRQYLPRSLIQPVHLYTERRERFVQLGAELEVSQALKRAETNRKSAETRARNKNRKEQERAKASTTFERAARGG